MVDIARPDQSKKKRIRRIAYGSAALLVIVLITVGVSRLKPAAPSVDRSAVWVDVVKRGPMVRAVRGSGTLVPEDIRAITATTQGRVERIVIRPGAIVKPDTVILELSNPNLQQAVREAQLASASAKANYINRKAELESQLLGQESQVANIETMYRNAALQLEANEILAKDGLISQITLKQSRSASDDLKHRLSIAKKQLDMQREGIKSQLAPQEAAVNQTAAVYQLRISEMEDLKVRARMEGVLQQIPVTITPGAQVGPGTILASVADPSNLKAELRIAETQTKDIRLGQEAEVDTRNGKVKGRVARIDPRAEGGTVGVDVILEGALPAGARPDLSIDGEITLERLPDVTFMGAPAFGQENSTVSLFKLTADGTEAERITVKLGRRSVNQVEIVEGLKPGDQVILSDTTAQDGFDRIRLN
jgi:HlyD family secretion protein